MKAVRLVGALALAISLGGTAWATDDPVTLEIEGAQGAVVTMAGMTTRECAAVSALLATKPAKQSTGISLYSQGSTITLGEPTGAPLPAPRGTGIVEARCVRDVDGKK